jgi:hypothetical protein
VEAVNDQEGNELTNVIQMFVPASRRRWEATEDELAEYRRIRPLLLQMLQEWETAKNRQHGCPVLANILAPPLTS